MLPASYSTVADVVGRYPPMGSLTRLTEGEIHNAIGAEQARIDGMLGGRYLTPFSPVPPIIEMICGDLACLRIVDTRVLIVQQTKGAAEWTETWRHAFDLLKMLSTGSLDLMSGSGTPIDPLPGDGRAYAPVWSDTMTTTPSFIGQDLWADVDGRYDRYWPI